MDRDDILLVGFGAVGVIYALILSKTPNVRVTAIARGNFDKVSTKGIDIKSKKHGNIPGWKPDRVVSSVAEAADRAYKYVLIATKALPDVNPTPRILAPLLTEEYYQKYPSPTFSSWKVKPQVLSAAVYIQANLIGGRDIVEQGPFDKLVCGVYRPGSLVDDDPKNTPEEVEKLEAFAQLIRAGNGEIEIVPDIQRKKFAKNLWPGRNSFGCAEAVSVARALGYSEKAVPSSLIEGTIEDTAALHRPGETSTHKPSMLVDMETRRPLEIEAIIGEVVRVGKERNVDVRTLETIYTLLQVVQVGLLKAHTYNM
ncbi:6-phosphogluconate dehydrogenase C-terminal domain-like protein [Rhizoctonia solani]|uniref:6-phosphogluconate dehydrogenase C-terminal domain-like protein n=1 Tax=Rhizoctonia solani TaxID=456999 RepID=A0A8H7I6F0_9AGAM|nr:6-phosphogluconate dehydrogenase C-terminal domain-like protein [Rhizoctonia solani]